jgi:hypothetical protein
MCASLRCPVPPVRLGGDQPKRVGQRQRVRRPLPWIPRHPRRDQRPQCVRYQFERHPLIPVPAHLCHRFPDERRPAGQAFVEGGRRRVNIAGREGGRAVELLGRHIARRSGHERPVAGRDPEVGQPAGAVPVDQHVLRLEVAVHNAAAVGGSQPEQRTEQDNQCGLGGRVPLPDQDLAQRDPVYQLRHDRRAVLGLDVLVDAHHMIVVQPGQHR